MSKELRQLQECQKVRMALGAIVEDLCEAGMPEATANTLFAHLQSKSDVLPIRKILKKIRKSVE